MVNWARVAAERKEEGGFGLSWIIVETLILFSLYCYYVLFTIVLCFTDRTPGTGLLFLNFKLLTNLNLQAFKEKVEMSWNSPYCQHNWHFCMRFDMSNQEEPWKQVTKPWEVWNRKSGFSDQTSTSYGEPLVPISSIASDKTQSLVLKYQSLVIKLNR